MGIVSFRGVGTSLGRGDSGGPVAGSGKAVPAGIEAIFEFNGLYMNIRDWWDKIVVLDIDGLDDADVRDAREVNPGDHGETPLGSFYGGRNITLTGKLECYSLNKLRDMQQAIRSAFAPLVEKPLIIRTGDPDTTVYINCKKVGKIAMKESQTDMRFFRDFQIPLRASNPFIRSLYQEYKSVSVETPPASLQAINLGDWEASPRLVLIGPMTDPVITNIENGHQIVINGTIPAGEIWTHDTVKKKLMDANGVNKYGALDVTTDRFRLVEQTDNTVQITATGTTVASQLQVFWNHTWL